jgi:hypothetical protein
LDEKFDDQFTYHDEFSLSSHVGFMLRHNLTETAARKDFSSGNSRHNVLGAAARFGPAASQMPQAAH